jgi:hypothetical protein
MSGGSRKPGLQAGVYSMVPRDLPSHERKKLAREKLNDIHHRQRAGLADPPLQIDQTEHDRILAVLLKEGKKAKFPIPGRPDLFHLTQEDYWRAVERGI